MATSQPPGRWIRLSAGYQMDPRIIRAGARAELVYIRGLALARQIHTDGHLMTEHTSMLTRGLGRGLVLPDALVEAGLWDRCDDGWRVPIERWTRWQVAEEDLEQRRAAEAARKAKYRASRKEKP